MPAPDGAAQRRPRLADRLQAARRFVGRAAELALFQAALEVAPPPFAVLYLYGPGGIGKSSLLQQYAQLAASQGRSAALIDSRSLDVSPQGFLGALSLALGLGEPSSALDRLTQIERPVLLLDTYETLAPLDSWLREVCLPQLPADALVVIAGRSPPSAPWRSGLWRELIKVVALRNLRPEESATYLGARGVPTSQHAAALAFTHGHPLALSLVADLAAQSGATALRPDQAPDVVALLLERFIQDVPSPQHRMALHACATARVLTEPLLRAALQQPDVQALFAWLRGLSFIEQGPLGIFPHDLAREVLDNDLRWRDPEVYTELRRRVRDGVLGRIMERQSQSLEQMRAMFDLAFLHRHSPILKPYFAWKELGTFYAEPVRPAEHAAMLRKVAALAGEQAADLAEHWLQHQPEAWFVVRDAAGQITDAFMDLALHAVSDEQRALDPAAAYAWAHVRRHTPLRPGDEVLFARFYPDLATYHEPTSIGNTIQLTMGLRWLTNPRLAWSFVEPPGPDHWYAMLSYYDMQRLTDPRFSLYAHDWLTTPAPVWIDKIDGRALATDLRLEELAAASAAALVVLSQPEFEQAVRAALRDFQSLEGLARSPLLRSRVLRDFAAATPSAADLQALLRQAAQSIRARPRDEKFFRAIEATYFAQVASQGLAAERLGLPFNTYRYQLAQGLERLTAWLWQREIAGSEG
jgi:hypothetical protein